MDIKNVSFRLKSSSRYVGISSFFIRLLNHHRRLPHFSFKGNTIYFFSPLTSLSEDKSTASLHSECGDVRVFLLTSAHQSHSWQSAIRIFFSRRSWWVLIASETPMMRSDDHSCRPCSCWLNLVKLLCYVFVCA
jgi:hypothetical protein